MDTRSRANPTTAVARTPARQRELDHAGLTWVDVTQPAAADVAALRERFGFDPLPLEHVLSTARRPRLDVYAEREYVYVELHVPVFDRENVVVPVEVSIFASRQAVVVLHDGTLKPLRRIFAAAASDDVARVQLMGRGPGYLLYRVIDALLKNVFPVLYRVDDALAQLDARLAGAVGEQLVRDLGVTRRDVIAIRAIVQPNREVTERLRQLNAPFLRITSAHYYGDNDQMARKVWDLVEEHVAVVAGLQATADSLIAEHAASRGRITALLLLALLALAFFAAVGAWQGALPALSQPAAVAGAALLALVLAGGLYAWFHTKKWI